MSRRPPSMRDPEMVVSHRVFPTVRKLLPGTLASPTAQPLPRPLPNREVPAGGKPETYRSMNLRMISHAFAGQGITQRNVLPLSYALSTGYHEASGVFYFGTSNAPCYTELDSSADYTEFGAEVTRLASSTGTGDGSATELLTGSYVRTRTGGSVSGPSYTGTWFDVDSDDTTLFFKVAGLYFIRTFLAWSS